MAAAEAAPFAKTGGLGDVVGSLPKALRRQGIDARVILPYYQSIAPQYRREMKFIKAITVPVAWRQQYCGLFRLDHDGVPFYFVDNLQYFDRPNLYGFLDEAERYAFFCRAVLEALPHIEFFPQVLHCHDWHTGMISPFLTAHYRADQRYAPIRTVFTIHNLKYQGVFPKTIMGDVLDLGWDYFTLNGVEFYDQVNFMKAGLVYSDLLTTVSRSYATEIQYPFFGEKLDGLLSRRSGDLYGIINGIDYELYNPATDKHIYRTYGKELFPKKENKVSLQQELGLPAEPDTPLIAIVGRLVSQKGLDLIACVLNEILTMNIQLVVLGTGEEQYQDLFWQVTDRFPRRVSANIRFDDTLARRIYAGADLLLMPSLYEPCGISQMIAIRYGTLPIVRETGGLKDTVRPYNHFTRQGNGFSFTNYNAHDMLNTIRRAVTLYRDYPTWLTIVEQAMSEDFSWNKSAQEYRSVYDRLTAKEIAHGTKQRGI